jgi:hypothetical protein
MLKVTYRARLLDRDVMPPSACLQTDEPVSGGSSQGIA